MSGAATERRRSELEGYHYVRVGQARARAAALAASDLNAQARLLLLVLAEVQQDGCAPMGPQVWQEALGVTTFEAELLIEALTSVGVLTTDSDLWCLHVHGRFADKGAGRRRGCGQAARDKRITARPRRRAYPSLVATGLPFRAPGTTPPA